MRNPRRVMIFAPHPDDETLGCGGYLAQKCAAGDDVRVIVMSDGSRLFSALLGILKNPSPAEVAAMRRNETLAAVEILGGRREHVRFLDFEDGCLERDRAAVIKRIVPLLRDFAPEEILCTSEFEQHPDHVAATGILREACAKAGCQARLLRYRISMKPGTSFESFAESLLRVDISRELPLKRKAVEMNRSHLSIISPRQKEPLARDFDRHLRPEELFLLDPGDPRGGQGR